MAKTMDQAAKRVMMLIWWFYGKSDIPENRIKFWALFPSLVTFLTVNGIKLLSFAWSVDRMTCAMWFNHSFGFKGKLWKHFLERETNKTGQNDKKRLF